jgi:hypothetical protein
METYKFSLLLGVSLGTLCVLLLLALVLLVSGGSEQVAVSAVIFLIGIISGWPYNIGLADRRGDDRCVGNSLANTRVAAVGVVNEPKQTGDFSLLALLPACAQLALNPAALVPRLGVLRVFLNERTNVT